MLTNKQRVDELLIGVKSILAKSGYAFSEEDKALLQSVVIELEMVSNDELGENLITASKFISLLLRLLQFFKVDDISELF